MAKDEEHGFFTGLTYGVLSGAMIGGAGGAFQTYWQAASPGGLKQGSRMIARNALPQMGVSAGYMAAVGGSFKAGEALMATWSGNSDTPANSAFGGLLAGLVMSFRSGSVPLMVATGVGSAALSAIIHLNGKTFRGPGKRDD